MKKIIGALILKLGNWKEEYPENFGNKNCILISAPHTSFKDYLYSIASFWKQGIDVYFLYNNSDRVSILKCLFKKIIGSTSCNVTKVGINPAVNLFSNSNKMILAFPTESKLKKVERWKTEFYDVAVKANVPVALGYLDYSDKTLGVVHLFEVSGNKVEDLKKIEKFYKNFTPRIPENYNTKII